MSTRKPSSNSLQHRNCRLVAGLLMMWATSTHAEGPNLGQIASPEEIRRWSLNVFPDGRGLPAGKGNVADGTSVYEQKCQSCHGPKGIGASADELAGTRHKLTDPNPDKAIGNYWPYATTLFDFIRRSMPLDSPGSLTDDQVYSVTAYLLYLNGVVDIQAVMDAQSLPKVAMPNRDGFVRIDAQ